MIAPTECQLSNTNIVNKVLTDLSNDEETEDASETDIITKPSVAIKEQLYLDKMANLKLQMKQLDNKSHPEYLKLLKSIQSKYEHRKLLSETYLELEIDRIKKEYENEKKSAKKEFKEKTAELKETLIAQLEEKKKAIETDWLSLDIFYDEYEGKLITTRKLRRRQNDIQLNSPEPTKRLKPSKPPVSTIKFLLDEAEIEEDLYIINRSNRG